MGMLDHAAIDIDMLKNRFEKLVQSKMILFLILRCGLTAVINHLLHAQQSARAMSMVDVFKEAIR